MPAIYSSPLSNEMKRFERRDLTDLIWLFLQTDPKRLISFSALAIAIEGLVLGIILAQISDQFSSLGPFWAIVSIIFGAITLFAQFGMNLWQTYRLIGKAATELLTIVVGDIRCNMTVLVFIGILNFVAAGFFGRRAWLLSKKKIWLLIPLGLGIFSSLGLSLGVAIKGYMLPSLAMNPTAKDLEKYDSWRRTDNNLIVIWAAIALTQDVIVCALMTAMLLKEKTGLQETEHGLLKLLIKLTYETMAGPVVLNIINVIVIAKQGATFADYSRLVTWVLGPVYFSSILQSLNYRRDVQRILNIAPTLRSASNDHQSTLRRAESPVLPLTSTLSTRQTSHMRYDSLTSATATDRTPTSKKNYGGTLEHEQNIELGRRGRTGTFGSMTSESGTIILGEKIVS